LLVYRKKQMWKILIAEALKGVTILGIGISLVVAMNAQPSHGLVYAKAVYGPPESCGPKQETRATSVDFIEPAVGVVTSPFGSRWGREHQGIDIGGEHGSPILAAKSGVVVYAGWADGYGNYLTLDHGNGVVTAYAHCDQLLVSVGDKVELGQEVAYMGSTGNSTGPHLHFEIQKDGVFLDPQEYGLY